MSKFLLCPYVDRLGYADNGADIVRVHDVKAMKRVAVVADAVVRGTEFTGY